MKCFALIKKMSVHLAGDKKVIPGEEMVQLKSAEEIVEEAKKQAEELKNKTAQECERLKKEAEERGFDEGLKKWNEQLSLLESERNSAKEEMQKALLPLTMVALKKILGKELEIHPEIIVDIAAAALKSVAQHRKISIYVRKADLEFLEKERPRLKALFENLQSLTIASKDEIQSGSCIIETEKGIMNVSLENQLKAIEEAFSSTRNVEKEGS